MKRILFLSMTGAVLVLAAFSISCGSDTKAEKPSLRDYEKWYGTGKLAAEKSWELMKKASVSPQKGNVIVLTNAGYAEVNGSPTQGALDGLSSVTGASRGLNTLVEIHTNPWTPLWFAVYDKHSGYCTYIEVDPAEAAKTDIRSETQSIRLFAFSAIERIDADHLFRHANEYKTIFDKKIFRGNEFRIVTIANAIAAGAPPYVVRVFEFHDHYCPGVTSGILTVLYLKKHFPPGESGYFVHSLEPWCKEDALQVLLNATPGKKSYAVSYPSRADMERRIPEAKNASTIIYRRNANTQKWEGSVFAFDWAETSCPETGNGIVDKLCTDIWYLDRLEKPEDFVKVIRTFGLPDGISPEDWARPGTDPLETLGLVQ